MPNLCNIWLKKNSLFEWTDACQNAFTHLRQCLVTAPVLAFPDYEQPFLLDTDASDVGIGAVLSQISDAGSERVIAYASRSLTRQERQYCVTRRELLAVVEFIQHFRHYLLGRQFTLRTDHSSIVWIQNFKEPEGQLARWMEKLQEYDFKVVHRRGTQHNNADALSRQPCKQCARDSHVVGAVMQWPFQSYTPEEMQKLQNDDPAIGPVLQAVGSGNYPSEDVVKSWSWEGRCLLQQSKMLHVLDGVMWRRFVNGGTTHHQLLLPSMLRDDVLGKLHDDVCGRSPWRSKTDASCTGTVLRAWLLRECESLVQDMCQMRQEKVSYPSKEGFHANNTSRVSYASGGSGHNGPSTRDR